MWFGVTPGLGACLFRLPKANTTNYSMLTKTNHPDGRYLLIC